MCDIVCVCVFFFNDTATTEIYTLSLHDALPICAPASYTAHFTLRQCPAFYTDRFSLRQRPHFIYCPFLAAAVPLHFILPTSRCGSAPLFILPICRCGSAPAFFTDHFSLRQRPRFLYCPFFVAAADRKSTRLNSSHTVISYAVFCLKKKKK